MAFGWSSLGHFFASAVSDLKKVSKAAPAVLTAIQKADEAAEKVTAIVAECGVPQASAALFIERAIDAAAGQLLAAIHGTPVPTDPKASVTVTITREAFDEYKQFLADHKDKLASLGYVIP